jgi:hypothetical protein
MMAFTVAMNDFHEMKALFILGELYCRRTCYPTTGASYNVAVYFWIL